MFKSREGFLAFYKIHEVHYSPTAHKKEREGGTMLFLYCDQEAYGDRTYYLCEEDNCIYSNYYSIGD